MPRSSQIAAALHNRHAPRDVTVRTWPLLDGGWTPRMIVAGGILASWSAGVASDSAATGLTIALAVLAAFWRLWLPTRYELGPQGIIQATLGRERRIAWSMVGRVVRCRSGVLVLRDFAPTPLEGLRGVYIPYGRQRDDLDAIFDFYMSGRAVQ